MSTDDTRRPERKEGLPTSRYVQLASSLEAFTVLVVRELAARGGTSKRGFVRAQCARAPRLMRSIFATYLDGDVDSGWVLFRCLLDRLFHLYDLIDNDAFERFEDWSFVESMNSRNRARSIPEFRERLHPAFWKDDPAATARWHQLCANPPTWSRPKPEDVAKRRGLRFLYTLGYDFASSKVHPMADDGRREFMEMIDKPDLYRSVDQRVLLHNAVLVTSLIVNEAVDSLGLRWRRPVVEYPHTLAECLVSGSDSHAELLSMIADIASSHPLSEEPASA